MSAVEAPTRALLIDGEDMTDRLSKAQATFKAASGSLMEFSMSGSLSGYEGADVQMRIGSGSASAMVPYFVGTLDEVAGEAKHVALGPFSGMAKQVFDEQVSYRGVNLNYFLYDLNRRAGNKAAQLTVENGETYTIKDTTFTAETTLQEAANSVLGPAQFVLRDMPRGRRIASPAIRPGQGGKAKRVYSSGDYAPGAFTVSLKESGYYASVFVFRRNPDGTYAARATASVANSSRHKPPQNRIYVVPEFQGDDAAASQTAYDVATRLSRGEWAGTLAIAADEEIEPHDTITAEASEYERDERFLATYECTLDGDLTLTVDARSQDMSFAFSALQVSRVLVPAAVYFIVPARSEVLLLLAPTGYDERGPWANSQNSWLGRDGAGLFFDFDDPARNAWTGRDADGLYIMAEET